MRRGERREVVGDRTGGRDHDVGARDRKERRRAEVCALLLDGGGGSGGGGGGNGTVEVERLEVRCRSTGPAEGLSGLSGRETISRSLSTKKEELDMSTRARCGAEIEQGAR